MNLQSTGQNCYLRSVIFDPEHTVAFTGHRTYKVTADAALCATISGLYARGRRIFLSGMAVGFDMAAAEAVLACRAFNPDLQLVCVVPFIGQEQRFVQADRERYRQILTVADETIVLAPAYTPACYTRRNNYLVDHSTTLVAWYDGSPGGTDYTLRRALRRGLEVMNLCPASSGALFSDQRLF